MLNVAAATPPTGSHEWLKLALELLGLLFAALAAFFGFFEFRSWLDGRRARRREMTERPMTRDLPPDFSALAAACGVTATADGLQMEPWIPRHAIDNVLKNIPARLALIGSRGVGKSRIATEAVRLLQQQTPNRSILFWKRRLPPIGSLRDLNPHRPILILDDLRPTSGHNEAENPHQSDEIGERLAEILRQLSNESGEHEDSITVIVTTWPENADWLRAEFDGAGFQYVEVDNPSEPEKRRYATAIAPSFKPLNVGPEVVNVLVKCSTYRDIFQCMRSLAKNGLTSPSPADVDKVRATTWEQELKSFTPYERLLLNDLTVLDQFDLPTDQRVITVIFAAGLRGTLGGRLNCGHDSAKTINRLRSCALHLDWYCGQLCRRTIEDLRQKRYVGASDIITSDQQDADAAHSGTSLYQEELRAVVTVFKTACTSSSSIMARTVWFPLVVRAGELLFKEGLFVEAISLDQHLLDLGETRVPIPSSQTRSQLLHYIGFNMYSIARRDPAIAAVYQRALAADPQNVKAKHSLATLYINSQQYEQALALYRDILADNPGDILTHKTLLDLYLRGAASWASVERSYDCLASVLRFEENTPVASMVGITLARADAARIVDTDALITDDEFRKRLEQVGREFREAIQRAPASRLAGAEFHYGVFLYDVAGRADEGIAELESALTALGTSYLRHSSQGRGLAAGILYKLASCYDMQAEIRPAEERQFRAKLERLTSDSRWHLSGRARKKYSFFGALEYGREQKWNTLPEGLFWQRVEEAYRRFHAALLNAAVEVSELLHNARVHHQCGLFLWHVDRVSYKRGLSAERPVGLATARVEFEASLTSDEMIVPQDHALRRKGVAEAASFLGMYLVATGEPEEAAAYLKQAEETAKYTSSRVRYLGLEVEPRVVISKLLISVGLAQDATKVLKSVVEENPQHWLAWWFLGRAYEAQYHLAEAFDSFWRAANGYSAPVYFSHLRSILDGWQDPYLEELQSICSFRVQGLKKSSHSQGYHFRVLGHRIPQRDDLAAIADAPTRKYLCEFFDHCRGLKAGLEAAHWDGKRVRMLMLDCARMAYKLDEEGALNPRNITDYAYDLLQAGELPRAQKLFESVVRFEQIRGYKPPHFALWQIGECIRRKFRRLTTESARYFIRAAAVEDTVNGYKALARILRAYAGTGEELAGLFLDVFSENGQYASRLLIENIVPACLEPMWKKGAPVSEALVDRLITFERDHPSRAAIEVLAVTLERRHRDEQALSFFEKLDKVEGLPDYVLCSYKECLTRLNHQPSDEVAALLESRLCRKSARVGSSDSECE